MDNNYNSVGIARDLLQHKIRICGTIRKNRGLSRNLQVAGKNMKRGESKSRRSGDVILLIAASFVEPQALEEDVGHVPSNRPPHKDIVGRLSGDMKSHRLVPTQPTEKKKSPNRHCRVCLQNKQRGDS
ncbi:hypothetical protein PR048_029070 [Dryococelus australis]|uniref:PiggyBac transposable element-derived protein domain-containing protein n=1 Tax=Dryococelus australis TaxID=614101 RepID=A0ABQ9GFT0_9NEOP|nr:hypothetical protein PR048_029070 [Dryococelus australis]